MGIEIVTGTKTKESGEIISFPELGKIYTYDELKEIEEINSLMQDGNNDFEVEDYDNDNDWCDYFTIFGVSSSEMASDLGIDVSEINESMIMEYAGY